MERPELEKLSRDELVAFAEKVGVARPRVLTQPELIDEIVTRTTSSPKERARARGWLGRARDLLARVVEKGLHLPEAARALRTPGGEPWPAPPPPLPTVTLAEIYAAQGYLDRAVATLDEVLAREPEHAEAKGLRARFGDALARRSRPPQARPDRELEHEVEREQAAADAGRATSSPKAGQHAHEVTRAIDPAPEATREPAASDAAAAREVPVAHVVETAVAPAPAQAPSETTAAALPPVQDAPLPERYDVDEIVAIAVDPRTIYVYWEVRPTTLARALASAPAGHLVVRAVSVVASWHGPESSTRDVRVDELYGDRYLRDVTPGAHVRVSIGWAESDRFEPFAVGIEVTAPRILPSVDVAQTFGTWSQEPVAAFTQPTPWRPREGHEHAIARGSAATTDVSSPNLGAAFEGAATSMEGGSRRISGPSSDAAIDAFDPTAPDMPQVIEAIRQRVIERLRRTGASEFAREREIVLEREILERRRLGLPHRAGYGGASDLVR